MSPRPAGTPTWLDVMTADIAGTASFMSALLGWDISSPDPTANGYVIASLDGEPVCGVMPGLGPTEPDLANLYLAVDDVEEALARCKQAGATPRVLAHDMEFMAAGDHGRMAFLHDPSGALVALWEAGRMAGFATGQARGPAWFELVTRDVEKACTFYAEAFGAEVGPIDHDPAYRLVRIAGSPVFGIAPVSDVAPPHLASHWLVYFAVDDVEACANRVVELGGAVVEGPSTTVDGVFATCTTPGGARFGVLTEG